MIIETGTVELDTNGTKTITLESTFTSQPTIYISPGGSADSIDPGSAHNISAYDGQPQDPVPRGLGAIPSYNVNCYISNISYASGAWTFTVNSEPKNETVQPNNDAQTNAHKALYGTYTSVKISWRAMGPTLGT